MMVMIIIIEIDVMQQVFSLSVRPFQSIIVIDNCRLYGVICIQSTSNVQRWHVIVHQSLFVICLTSNAKFIIELRQLAKNVFRQSSKYIQMKNILPCRYSRRRRCRQCWWPSIVRCKHCVIVVDWNSFDDDDDGISLRWYSQTWTDGIN